jgi:phage repressor protein C with HTH and peptisase S24 domain
MEEELSPLSQRINSIVNTLENGVQRRFALKVGARPGQISEVLGERRAKPSSDLLEKIGKAYPEIRIDWLLLGTGEMLKSAESDAQVQKTSSYEPAPFDAHAVGPLTDQPHVDLPFPDFKTLAHFGQQPGLSLKSFINSPTLRVYLEPGELPEKYDGAMVIEVWGDSMEPNLYSGDRMIVWQVPESKWESLHNVDCVVAYDETVTIKAIAENDLFVHDRLTLRAANPPTSYFVVGRASINSIWEVGEYYKRPKYVPSARRR